MAGTEKKTAPVYKKLRAVQKAMNVAKDEKGRFGAHRTAEGIIEHAKPLLDKEELTLTLDSSIVCINGQNYINSIATVFDDEGNSVSASGQAWEGDGTSMNSKGEKVGRGLDSPQVTGSATSYARKYALGGLFAVADGKDDPDQRKDEPTTPTMPEKPRIATGPEKFKLQQMMKEKGMETADEMTLFVESVIGKKRVGSHDEFVEVYHALTDGVDDQPGDGEDQSVDT